MITALAKSTHPCLSQEVEDAGKLPKSPTEMPSKFRGTKRMSSEKNPRPKIHDEDRMKIRKKYVDKRKFNNRSSFMSVPRTKIVDLHDCKAALLLSLSRAASLQPIV